MMFNIASLYRPDLWGRAEGTLTRAEALGTSVRTVKRVDVPEISTRGVAALTGTHQSTTVRDHQKSDADASVSEPDPAAYRTASASALSASTYCSACPRNSSSLMRAGSSST